MKTIAFTICMVNKKMANYEDGFLSCGEANGYVAVPPEHPLYGKDYYDIDNIDVHGGLTFSDKIDFATIPVEDIEFITNIKEVPSDWWVFGFDTIHLGDNKDNWPKERVIEETLRLQEQLENMPFDKILEANKDVLKRLKEK